MVVIRAQVPAGSATTPQVVQTQPAAIPKVTLTVGRSTILETPFDISRIAVTSDAIAEATAVDTREILIDGKAPGTVSMIVWGDSRRAQYDLVIDPGVSLLQRQLQALFPGEDLIVHETPDAIILTGHASDNNVMLRAGEIAEAIAPKAKIINMLQLPGGGGSQQVMLQVRIAEVNRRAVSELGASIFTGGTGYKNVVARGTTQQYPSANYDNLRQVYDSNGNLVSATGEMTFTDFLNIFVFSNKYALGTLIKALQTSGNFQSLAEPNLIAYNGQEASFLAGGELPVPIVQGNSGQVSIQYKEFGVRLTFRPTIAGDVIRLRVRPEVSALDFANGISLGGFRVPALTTRRAETDVELRDGQSFAIGGLINNSAQDSKENVPVLSAIPIIGELFKSRGTNRDRTELLVLVTPHLVTALNPDQVPPLPTLPERFLPPCEKPPCDGTPAKPAGGRGGSGGGETPSAAPDTKSPATPANKKSGS
jgi:pilus assembly protein CpaC